MLDGEDLLSVDAAARARYSPLFDLGSRLLRFGSVLPPAGSILYAGASPKIVTGTVLPLFVQASKTMRGIQHLSGNVLTEPALMLLRSLSETWAALGFIAADPARRAERAHWYLIGEAVENYTWSEQLRKADLGELIPPAVLANPDAMLEEARQALVERETIERGADGADRRAEELLNRMRRRGQWGNVTQPEMYTIAERWANQTDDQAAVVYVTIFKFTSGILHGRKPDLLMRMRDDGLLQANLRADPTFLTLVLYMGSLLYISTLRAVNEIFALPWASPIQGFQEDLVAWRRSQLGQAALA